MDEKEIEMIAEEELEKAQKADGEAEAEKAEAEGAAEIEAKELETYKEMSPFRLVLRRFFRSKLSIVGLVMIVFLFAFSFLMAGFNIFTSSFFTALNNGAISAAISFLRTLVFQTLCVLLLPLLFGLDGIWWAMTVAEVFALGLSILFLATQRRRYHYL